MKYEEQARRRYGYRVGIAIFVVLMAGWYFLDVDVDGQNSEPSSINNNAVEGLVSVSVNSKPPTSWGDQECGGQTVSPFLSNNACVYRSPNRFWRADYDDADKEPSPEPIPERMNKIIIKGLAADSNDLKSYLELSNICESNPDCDKATLAASDAKFLTTITELAARDNGAAKNALGVWWYRTAENLVSERSISEPTIWPQDKGDVDVFKAELLAFRLATPGFAEAIGKSASYFRQAESKGDLDSGILQFMVSQGWVK